MSRDEILQEGFLLIIPIKTYHTSLHLIMDNVNLEKPSHLLEEERK